MSMKYELMEGVPQNAVIKVIGVGGGGCNAVQHMVAAGVVGVEFIGMNTDAQALALMNARTLQLGTNLTKGLGAGSDPGKGREAALEDRERIADVIRDADMVFITAGMGGGTGTGAAPVVAQVAKDLGILTVAVVTKPFAMERRKRMEVAITGIDELSKYVDSLITIPNEKLLTVLPKDTTLQAAFGKVNEVLHGAVRGIADLITHTGQMNVDFADVKTVMSEMGMAMMGTGRASGEERARTAAGLAISSPLLDDIKVAGAKGLLVNVTAAPDRIGMTEIAELNEFFDGIADPDATFKLGVAYDETLGDEIRVTIIATGLGRPIARRANEPVMVGPGVVNRQPVAPVVAQVQAPVTSAPAPAFAAEQAPAQAPAPAAAAPVAPAPAVQAVPRQVVRVANGGEVDYSQYETPAVSRQGGGSGGPQQPDLLNVPAFLRRQAD
jgi:cell division protein FtsZ